MKKFFNFSGRNNILAALVLLVALFTSCAGELSNNASFEVSIENPEIIVEDLTPTKVVKVQKKGENAWQILLSDGNTANVPCFGTLKIKDVRANDLIEESNDENSKRVSLFVGANAETGTSLGEKRVSYIKRVNPDPVIIRDTIVMRDTVYVEPAPGVVKAFLVADTAMRYTRNADVVKATMKHRLVKVEIWNTGETTKDTLWNKTFQVAEASVAALNGKVYSKLPASSLVYASNINWNDTKESSDGAFKLTTRTGEATYAGSYTNMDGKSENWAGNNALTVSDVKVIYEEYSAEYKFDLASVFGNQKEESRKVSDESQFTYNGTSVASFDLALNGAVLGTQNISLDIFKPVEKIEVVRIRWEADTTMNYALTAKKATIKMSHKLTKITEFSNGTEEKSEVWNKTFQVGKMMLSSNSGYVFSLTPAKDFVYSSNFLWADTTTEQDEAFTLTNRAGDLESLAAYTCDAGTAQQFEGRNATYETDLKVSYEGYEASYKFSFSTEFLGQREENRGLDGKFAENHQFTYGGTTIGTWKVLFNGVNVGTHEMEADVYIY